MLRLMCAFYLNICWFCSFVFSIFCSFSYLPVGYLKVFLEFCFDLSLQMCSFVFLRFCLVESFLLCRLLCLRSTGATLQLQRTGLSLGWLLLLHSTAFRRPGFRNCHLQALQHWVSSCGAQAQLPHGMWDLPRAEIEPVSPELAGRFLTNRSSRKPLYCS